VPWNRLPKIKAIAPEFYVELKSHMSWTRLFFQFLFDRELSLFSRMVREDRNRVGLSDEVRPDLDVIEGTKPAVAKTAPVAARQALGTS